MPRNPIYSSPAEDYRNTRRRPSINANSCMKNTAEHTIEIDATLATSSDSDSSCASELSFIFRNRGQRSDSISRLRPGIRTKDSIRAPPVDPHLIQLPRNTILLIADTSSRSRRPIVGRQVEEFQHLYAKRTMSKGEDGCAVEAVASSPDIDENNQSAYASLTSTLTLTNPNSATQDHVREPLISSASFERRRNVYEPVGGGGSRVQSASLKSTVDDLSLDEILAKLESSEIEPAAVVDSSEAQAFEQTGSQEHKRTTNTSDKLISSYPMGGHGEMSDKSLTTSLSSSSLEQSKSRRPSKDNNNNENSAERKRHEIEHGFEIAWLEFTYSVEPNVLEDPRWGRINKLFHKERRTILKGLSGGLKSGQMVALMGPSGAGKTCLLESISGVRAATEIGGRICLRGRKKVQLVIVPQYDDFLPQFTVEETIIYGSRMKNSFGTNHRKVANTVIEQLGLEVCRHNNIQRCSGGQRKRVAIAQELVSKPNILILDEPTSGLDSSCCYHTMKVLRDVLDKSVKTDQPMTIISTIHQPSAKVFRMFDLVYLLGKTGYAAYSGPPDELVSTIRDVTGLECPQYSNPSDFMIELVAYDYGEEPVEKLIEFECQKAALFVKEFDKRAGIGVSATGKARGRPTSSTSRTTSMVNPSSSVSSPRKASKINDDAAAGNQTVTSADSMELMSTNGSMYSNSNSLQIHGPRLAPSKSDTHLAAAHRADYVQQLVKSSSLLMSNHVEYRNNVTVPLRKAASNAGRKHPFFWHTWIHLHRSFLQSIRDPILNNMRILIHLGFASLLVMLYGKKSGEARGCPPILGLPTEITDPNNESMIDLADNVGYLFMCIMMITYVSLMSTVLTFPIDIKTVGKEYKNGWYGTVTYFLGKTIADLPFIILYPVVYCLITWYMTNQADDHLWRYFSFTGLIIMNAMNSQSFGLILGALFVNSVTAATFLGPVITIPWYLFTGFTKRIHRLAEPFKSTSKFLFTRYVFEGILDTVYGHQRCNCSEFLQQYYELRFEEANRLGQLVSMETLSSLDYYDGLDTVANVSLIAEPEKSSSSPSWFERTFDAASTVFADGEDLNLANLMESNVKASSLFSFGLDFEPTCPSNYETFVVQDFRLGEKNVQKAFVVVLCILVAIRLITFILVAWKIRTRQL